MPRGTTPAPDGPRSWPAPLLFLFHFFLELAQLPVGRGFPRGAVEQVCLVARPPRRLQVAPRALRGALRLRDRTILLRARQLRPHVSQLPLVQGELVPQRRQLLVEHAHALPVLRREPPGHGDGLRVLDPGPDPPAPPPTPDPRPPFPDPPPGPPAAPPAPAAGSVSWISDASRPRRSASASRWRSCASSRSVRATASPVSTTATFASTTASRICRARSRRSPGGVAASRAARRASRR